MKHVILGFLIAGLAAAPAAPALAQAGNAGVTVIVNGQTMQFDQPPMEQTGRVFVPLRGIFEQLGASVVYQNGTINATSSGRAITLRIGSNQATVNGQQETLDSPPFMEGSRTLVPLRFIAEALGATVDWNNNTSTVTITGAGGGGPNRHYNANGNQHNNGYNNNQPPAQPMNADNYLTDRQPLDTAVGPRSVISARFAVPVRHDSIRIMLDGRDVTSAVDFNDRGFQWTPERRLDPGMHHVRVNGTTQDGAAFSTGWDFRVNP